MTLKPGTRLGPPDGAAYVYNFWRRLSDLHLVERLK